MELIGLVDSGAMATRVHIDIATELELDLSSAERTEFSVGGADFDGWTLPARLNVDGYVWDAPVCFTEGWPHPHQLLGLRGFFDHLVVRIEASKLSLRLTPSRHAR